MDFQRAKDFIIDRLRNELPVELNYHSLAHTLDVTEAATRLALAEGVSGEDLVLLQTASLYHDCGFTVTYREHEQAGCEIARQNLPGFGFNDEAIEKICGMIMATRIPQTPHNLLEQIIADADLDYLGRHDFEPIADSLYREFMFKGIVKNETEWYQLQKRFFESHHYFTATARKTREPLKQKHYEWICNKVAMLTKAA